MSDAIWKSIIVKLDERTTELEIQVADSDENAEAVETFQEIISHL